MAPAIFYGLRSVLAHIHSHLFFPSPLKLLTTDRMSLPPLRGFLGAICHSPICMVVSPYFSLLASLGFCCP